MNSSTTTRNGPSTGGVAARAALALTVAAVLGFTTALSGPFLDPALGRVINTPWEWTVFAFGLVWWSRARPGAAAALGVAAFLLLNVGFAAGSPTADGTTYAISGDNFWVVVGFIAGPLVGLGASWVRHRDDALAALGAGGLAGVVLGDGWNGLTLYPFVPPTYWVVLIAAGLGGLLVVSTVRLHGAAAHAAAVVTAVLLAAAYHLVTVAYVGGLASNAGIG